MSDNGISMSVSESNPSPSIELPGRVHARVRAESKINTWKRCYYSLALILERSGVGFNSDGDFKIECNDKKWAQIEKADSNAEDMLNADEKLHAHPAPIPETQPSDYNFSLDDFYTQKQIAESLNLGHKKVKENKKGAGVDRSSKNSSSMKKISFKRKTMDAILEVITKMHTNSNDRLGKLSTCIGSLSALINLFTGMSEVDKYDYLMHILEEKHGV
ncbi:hypothetical protein AAHA92_12395 [Salvia divinorum]|uniref:Uncharacterized protein n=1 Tax=Salvia divinorum TaxID=28513 RepID=A0ABD1HLE3_SALDI